MGRNAECGFVLATYPFGPTPAEPQLGMMILNYSWYADPPAISAQAPQPRDPCYPLAPGFALLDGNLRLRVMTASITNLVAPDKGLAIRNPAHRTGPNQATRQL